MKKKHFFSFNIDFGLKLDQSSLCVWKFIEPNGLFLYSGYSGLYRD